MLQDKKLGWRFARASARKRRDKLSEDHSPKFIKQRPTLWQFVMALATLAVALISVWSIRQANKSLKGAQESIRIASESLNQADSSLKMANESLSLTRELFIIQNRPYVDVESVNDQSRLDLFTDEHGFGCEIILVNSGNLPAVVTGLTCLFQFEKIGIDTSLHFTTKIYPQKNDLRKVEFFHETGQLFGEKIKTQYPQQKNEYDKYLRVFLCVKYKCLELNLIDSSKSVWQNRYRSNHLTRIE